MRRTQPLRTAPASRAVTQRRSKSRVTQRAEVSPPRSRFHHRLTYAEGHAIARRAHTIERDLARQFDQHLAKVGMAATSTQIHGAKEHVGRTISRAEIGGAPLLLMSQKNIADFFSHVVTRVASLGIVPTTRTRQQFSGNPEGLHCASTSSPEHCPSHARASTACGLSQVQHGSCMRSIGINSSCEQSRASPRPRHCSSRAQIPQSLSAEATRPDATQRDALATVVARQA